MKVFLLIALFCLLSVSANAQFVGTFKPGNIYGNPTGAEAPPIDSPTSSFGLVTGPASATNGDNACFGDTTGKLLVDCAGTAKAVVLTSNTTVAASNCSQVLYLQGGTQWKLTFPSAAGLPNGCIIEVVNSEPSYPVGKSITGISVSAANVDFILYPTQRFKVQVVAGAWAWITQPTRWVTPDGQKIIWYVSNTSGSDNPGLNDGLSPGRPFKTVNNAAYIALSLYDCNGAGSETDMIISLAPGQSDTTGLHWAPGRACSGGASVQLVGSSLSVTGAVNNGSGLCRLNLATTATFTGGISGTTLTVQALNMGDSNIAGHGGQGAQIVVGAAVTGTGVTGGTVITGQLTGSGGVGTYTVNNSQAVGTTGLTSSLAGGGSLYTTGEQVMVYGIAGATGCNGLFKVNAVNSTQVDLQASTFGGAYTSGGTITEGSAINGGADLETFFGTGIVQVWNLLFVDTVGNSLLTATDGSQIYVEQGNIFAGAKSSADFFAQRQGRIVVIWPYGISGTQTSQVAHMEAIQQGLISITQTGGIYLLAGTGLVYSVAFAYADQTGYIVAGEPITVGAGTVVSATRCRAGINSATDSGTGTPNTYWPGNSNCTITVNGVNN